MSNADLDLLQPLFGLLIAFIVGGGISKGLENLAAWRNWCPAPNLKMFVVFVLTALLGGAVVWVQQWLLPQYWSSMPDSLKVFILSVAAFVVSQRVRANDKRSENAKPE